MLASIGLLFVARFFFFITALISVFVINLLSSVAQLCLTLCNPWTATCQASLSITNSQRILKLMSIELVMPSKHLILCHPLLLLPSIFPSIRVFSNKSVIYMRSQKYWSSSFSISPSSEYSGLISFKIDWFDLPAIHGTLKSLVQHHSSKASILQRSALFVVQHPYMTTGKTKTLTAQTFVGSYEINQMWVSVCQCQAHKEPSASSSGYFWNRESANN